MVERVVLVREVGDEQLGPAVAVDVLRIDPHARLACRSRRAGARGLGDVLERPVALVEEDEVRAHVVGDVEVDPAVAVQVRGDDPEAPAVGPADARRSVTSVNGAGPRCSDRGGAGRA